MNISKELLQKINELDIRVYGTFSGKIYIGECSEVFEDGVQLNYPAVLSSTTDGKFRFAPAVPGEYVKSTIVIYSRAVEMESLAGLRLKKDYLDYITSVRVSGLDNSETMNTYHDLDPKDYAEDYWHKLVGRLKP